MTKAPTLYEMKRVCCVCDASAKGNRRRLDPGEPNIAAISMLIYYRGEGKGQLNNARRVNVCVPCLTQALTGGWLIWGPGNLAVRKLWSALQASLLDRYSSIVEADKP